MKLFLPTIKKIYHELQRFSAAWADSDASITQRTVLAFIMGVAIFRSLVFLLRSFLPVGYPEVWRQTDTLGIALRNWMRWTIEAPSAPWWAPALLQSGDAVGVNATEFPLLTLLHAPWFAFGHFWGQHLAVFSHVLLVLGLGLVNARLWRHHRIMGVNAGAAMLLLPFFSLPMA